MNDKLIVVDIQPEYGKSISEWLWAETAKKVMSKNKVCWYYVDFGCESPSFSNDSSEEYWNLLDRLSQYLTEDEIDKIQFIPKTYGFLRDQMDSGIDDDLIVKQLKLMFQMRVNDSRDIWDNYSSVESHIKRKITMLKNSDDRIVDSVIYSPCFDTEILSQFKHAEMIGGGRHECLAELSLYMQALSIPHEINESLTY